MRESCPVFYLSVSFRATLNSFSRPASHIVLRLAAGTPSRLLSMVNHRLLKEYKELAKQNDPEISLSLADEADINGWEARGTRGSRSTTRHPQHPSHASLAATRCPRRCGARSLPAPPQPQPLPLQPPPPPPPQLSAATAAAASIHGRRITVLVHTLPPPPTRQARLRGPAGTPYEGGTFEIRLT